jgi:predicted DCC family thiol-disulfide oxidoreductase YuxK
MFKLILFYDGSCPLCAKEILLLKKYDTGNEIQFEDITLDNFPGRFRHIDLAKADAIIHGQLPDGRVITGMDVTFLAWEIVNRNKWLRLLKLPLLRPITDWCYLFFAKHRRRITRLLCKSLTD